MKVWSNAVWEKGEWERRWEGLASKFQQDSAGPSSSSSRSDS